MGSDAIIAAIALIDGIASIRGTIAAHRIIIASNRLIICFKTFELFKNIA
jgi:hypothetical protein